MSTHRVAITAMGCVSPLGMNREETLASLLSSRDSIAPVRFFKTDKFHSQSAGQVSPKLDAVAKSITPTACQWSRSSRMLLMALEECLSQRKSFHPEVASIGTTSGGMTHGELFYRSQGEPLSDAKNRTRVREYLPHQPVLNVIQAQGWDTSVRIVSNACASGTNAIGMGYQMIRNGTARRVLVGGYDELSEMVFAGFDCLRASTEEKCRPFDAARTGLALGEGAALFFLERLDDVSDTPILAEITGYGAATDTYHLTQPNPSGAGPRLAMERALLNASRPADSLDYINAHGTGTPQNDASEGVAILQLCPKVPVSSTKGMMGHSLGAAGAIEAGFCVHALTSGFLPANINYQTADAKLPLDIVANTIREGAITVTASNSFGFGGSNACLILEKFPS